MQQPYDTNDTDELTFFTDGSCDNPRDADLRRAAYAIVQMEEQHHEETTDTQKPIPSYTCKLTALVDGNQTISRAELLAVAAIAKQARQRKEHRRIRVYTDSQYVINVLQKIARGEHTLRSHKPRNWDIVQAVAEDIKEGETGKIMGNDKADRAVKHALQQSHDGTAQLAQSIAKQNVTQTQQLFAVFDYVRTTQIEKLQETEEKNQQHQKRKDSKGPMGWEAKEWLQTQPTGQATPLNLPRLPAYTAQGIVQGPLAAMQVWRWLQTLAWPEPSQETSDDVGITWMELYINFVVLFAAHLPLALTSAEAGAQRYVPYDSDEGQLLPIRRRNAFTQAYTPQAMVRTLKSVMGKGIFPTTGATARSLVRMGFADKCNKGITPRPRIQYPEETMEQVWKFMQANKEAPHIGHELHEMQVQPKYHIPRECVPVRTGGDQAQERATPTQGPQGRGLKAKRAYPVLFRIGATTTCPDAVTA